MSRLRDKIAQALEQRGIGFDSIDWYPIRRGSEMEGPVGGWEVWWGGTLVAWAYNADSLIEAIGAPDGLAHDHGCGVLRLERAS